MIPNIRGDAQFTCPDCGWKTRFTYKSKEDMKEKGKRIQEVHYTEVKHEVKNDNTN